MRQLFFTQIVDDRFVKTDLQTELRRIVNEVTANIEKVGGTVLVGEFRHLGSFGPNDPDPCTQYRCDMVVSRGQNRKWGDYLDAINKVKPVPYKFG